MSCSSCRVLRHGVRHTRRTHVVVVARTAHIATQTTPMNTRLFTPPSQIIWRAAPRGAAAAYARYARWQRRLRAVVVAPAQLSRASTPPQQSILMIDGARMPTPLRKHVAAALCPHTSPYSDERGVEASRSFTAKRQMRAEKQYTTPAGGDSAQARWSALLFMECRSRLSLREIAGGAAEGAAHNGRAERVERYAVSTATQATRVLPRATRRHVNVKEKCRAANHTLLYRFYIILFAMRGKALPCCAYATEMNIKAQQALFSTRRKVCFMLYMFTAYIYTYIM